MKTICLMLVSAVIFGCKAQNNSKKFELSSAEEKPCFITEETFENNALRKFLQTTEYRRDLIDNFVNSKSEFCILSIIDNKLVVANYNEYTWTIQNNETTYSIENNKIIPLIEEYAGLKKVYKMSCPENYTVFDANEFQVFWIKKNGNAEFLYYSVSYEMSELNYADRSKLSKINEIVEALKN